MATAQQIINIIIKAPLKIIKKKVIKRRRRKKMTFRDTMPTRGQDIKMHYIDILKKQIAHLEERLGNYTVSNDNTKMMKQEIKRLKKNLKKEVESINDGVPVAFSTRQPSVRIR
jgi:hypothetical protein